MTFLGPTPRPPQHGGRPDTAHRSSWRARPSKGSVSTVCSLCLGFLSMDLGTTQDAIGNLFFDLVAGLVGTQLVFFFLVKSYFLHWNCNLCIISASFETGIAIFTLLRKIVLSSIKNCNDLWLFLAASWSCVIFYTRIVKTTFSIMLQSGTTSEDTTSEQNRVHEGTAALQPRYTDARATPHMTPTSKDPDSFAGWSDTDVLQVVCGTHHFHKWASVVFLAR